MAPHRSYEFDFPVLQVPNYSGKAGIGDTLVILSQSFQFGVLVGFEVGGPFARLCVPPYRKDLIAVVSSRFGKLFKAYRRMYRAMADTDLRDLMMKVRGDDLDLSLVELVGGYSHVPFGGVRKESIILDFTDYAFFARRGIKFNEFVSPVREERRRS